MNNATDPTTSERAAERAPEATARPKEITVVVDAWAIDEDDDSPAYASFKIDLVLLQRMKDVAELCVQESLSEARIVRYPDWGGKEFEDEARVTTGELVITPNSSGANGPSCHFRAQRRYGSDFESRAQLVADLRAQFEEADDGAVLFMGDNVEGLRELYAGDLEEPEESEEAVADRG